MTKKKIERWTLWVLAIGLLAGVSLNVAKSVVREYRELQQEIHQPQATQANNNGSVQ